MHRFDSRHFTFSLLHSVRRPDLSVVIVAGFFEVSEISFAETPGEANGGRAEEFFRYRRRFPSAGKIRTHDHRVGIQNVALPDRLCGLFLSRIRQSKFLFHAVLRVAEDNSQRIGTAFAMSHDEVAIP